MLDATANIISEAWGNGWVRLAVVLASVGFVPFYFLSMAKACLVA